MKKMKVFYLIAFLVLLSVSVIMFSGIARAGAVSDGFAGVPWGANKDQVINIMGKRGYRQLGTKPLGDLVFSGEFAGVPCELSFRLIDDSFYEGYAWFGHTEKSQATFNRIVDMLSERYGPPQDRGSKTERTNDGKEHPSVFAKWEFVNDRSSDKYSIYVIYHVSWVADTRAEAQYVVDITYSADSLKKKLIEQIRHKPGPIVD